MRYDLRRMIQRTGNRRSNVVLRPIEPPSNLYLELYKITLPMFAEWQRNINERILPAYKRGTDQVVRDAADDEVAASIETSFLNSTRLIITLEGQLRQWAVRIQNWHQAKFAAGVSSATGIDPRAFLSSVDAADQVDAAQRWATGLIRDINEQTRQRIQSDVYSGFFNQVPRREMAKRMNKSLGLGKKRSLNIARDQTLKLAGNLDQMRQAEAGITKYKWVHSGKLHPRPEHVARDGKIFEWSKPPYDGHPRTQPNCGCIAQAYIDLMDEED